MSTTQTHDNPGSGSRWRGWLANVLSDTDATAEVRSPAVTRMEIAQWLAARVRPDLVQALHGLGRPGVFVVRCVFAGFESDLRAGLEAELAEPGSWDFLAGWPEDETEARTALRETVDALNAGRSRVLVLPHERMLRRHAPAVDAVLEVPRFSAETLRMACVSFFDLEAAPIVPAEPWVRLVTPSDLLISSEVAGDPVPAIRGATLRRLQAFDCGDAQPLDQLLGLNEVRVWAEDLIEDIRDALDPAVKCRWSDIERAVVFSGPRGVGRTALSRAIAKATGMRWLKASANRWMTIDAERWSITGESSASLLAMEEDFDLARQLAPCLLFIERLGSLSPDLLQALGRLIAENGDESPVLVVASETDEELPDTEALRAANFEHMVSLPLPSAKVLAAALGQRLQAIDHKISDAEVLQAGRLALGGTTADMHHYLRRALRIARRDGSRCLTFDDVAAAILDTPAASARPKVNEHELRVTAYHEAGHAVMKFLELDGGRDIQHLTVVPRRIGSGTALGFMLSSSDEERLSLSRAEAMSLLRTMLGGRAAEEVLLGRDHLTTGSGGSSASDLARCTRLASYLIGRCGLGDAGSLVFRPGGVDTDARLERQVDALIRKQYRLTLQTLRREWCRVTALAEQLLTQQELSGDAVRAVLAQAGPASRRLEAADPGAAGQPTAGRSCLVPAA